MKQNKKGSHSLETDKTNPLHFLWFFFILFVMLTVIFFMITFIKQTENNIEEIPYYNNLALSELHIVENSNNLISKEFSITEDNGLYKINGTIENSSEDVLNNLCLVYTLYDTFNNNVYEFEISISNLNAHNSTSFSSVCVTNLLNITGYSVSLVK